MEIAAVSEHCAIREVSVTAYIVPTDSPESDGTLEWDKTTLVLVYVQAGGKTGIGYTYADIAAAELIRGTLAPLLRGKDPMDVPACWSAMRHAIRNLGRPGISSMAIAAVDSAVWDLKAKLLNLPLVSLLGADQPSVEIYGSGGFTSYSIDQLQKQLGDWASQDIKAVKMKIGRNPNQDAARVKAAREAIGESISLYVDANGAYSRKQGLHMAQEFAECGVSWFEEPVTSDDLEGLRLIRDRAPSCMEIAAGEYGYDLPYFKRMLDAGAVDVQQADASRCAGISEFLRVGALCDASNIPMSAHTSPSLHLHPCCALSRLRNIEYFHDHVRIEKMFFDGVVTPVGGGFTPICRGQAWVSNSRKPMRNVMQHKERVIDSERKTRIQEALRNARLAAVVCSLPSDVLLLTGYWPVVGTSIAVCVCDGPTMLLVPEDETDLAQASFADSVNTFVPETLNEMRSVSEAIKPHLARILKSNKLHHGSIGVECGSSSQAASYLALHLYGNDLSQMLRALLPAATFVPIEEWLGALKSVKTPSELKNIRQACRIAQNAYELATPLLRAGMKESEAAQLFRARLSGLEVSGSPNQRCDGFAFCMSGPNSAVAYAAYAHTRFRTLEQTDLVMIHCNSYMDGFWTDITRSYTLQPPDDRQIKMQLAVVAGRKAAFEAIRPGVRAAEVDSGARQAIQSVSLDKYLKHGTGHGIGFSPMSACSIPRLHSGSTDVLQEGMVFNVEPAIYIQGYGGVRHCDTVAVTHSGYELLTDFQSDIESLAVMSFNYTPTIVTESNSIRTNPRLATV